tara:strand:+ start:2796 stop:3116 length:321 start_codon:yes stop_codon:yes gene_type:complete
MNTMFSSRLTHSAQASVLELTGRFDFSTYGSFKPIQAELLNQPGTSKIIIDMSQLEYLDSAALGILLLMREKAAERNKKVALRGVQGIVREILGVAHFEKLFEYIG